MNYDFNPFGPTAGHFANWLKFFKLLDILQIAGNYAKCPIILKLLMMMRSSV